MTHPDLAGRWAGNDNSTIRRSESSTRRPGHPWPARRRRKRPGPAERAEVTQVADGLWHVTGRCGPGMTGGSAPYRSALATMAMPASIISRPTIRLASIRSPVTSAETVSPITGTASRALEVVVAESRRFASVTAQ